MRVLSRLEIQNACLLKAQFYIYKTENIKCISILPGRGRFENTQVVNVDESGLELCAGTLRHLESFRLQSWTLLQPSERPFGTRNINFLYCYLLTSLHKPSNKCTLIHKLSDFLFSLCSAEVM